MSQQGRRDGFITPSPLTTLPYASMVDLALVPTAHAFLHGDAANLIKFAFGSPIVQGMVTAANRKIISARAPHIMSPADGGRAYR